MMEEDLNASPNKYPMSTNIHPILFKNL